MWVASGEKKHVQDSVGKPEGKGWLGRSRRRCDDNIKVGFKEIEWMIVGWIYMN